MKVPKPYEPEVIAIGPLTTGCKVKALERDGKAENAKSEKASSVKREDHYNIVTSYLMGMTELEERARSCYVESISLDSDQFAEMILLDVALSLGCFLTISHMAYGTILWIKKKIGS